MIKRPLIWIFFAYIIGVQLAKLNKTLSIFLIVGFLIFILLAMMVYKVSNNTINQQDRFLLLLPAVMFLGMFLMQQQLEVHPMENIFDDKMNGTIEGYVYQIDDMGDKFTLYLKDNVVKLNDTVYRSYHSEKGNKDLYQCTKMIIYTEQAPNLKLGNKLRIEGQIIKFQHPRNLGQFDEYQYNKTLGIDFKVYAKSISVLNSHCSKYHQLLYNLKKKLIHSYSSILSQKESGLITAMMLGDKTNLDSEIKKLYMENGISHILAISGLHVSLIGLFVYKVLRKLYCNIKCSVLFSVIFIYSYGAFTNFSVSTNRAVVMLIVSFIAVLIGKTYDILSSLSLSALIILVQNPMQIYNTGFLLSFGAVLAIAVLVPIFENLFFHKNDEDIEENSKEEQSKMKESIKKVLIESILVSFAVNLVTMPILLYYFYEFSTYSIIVNLIIIPLTSMLVLLAFLGGIVGCFSLFLGQFFIGGAHYILLLYEIVCRCFVKLPHHMILVGRPKTWQILIYYIFLMLFIFLISRFTKKYILIILIGLLIIFVPMSRKGFEVTFLDVGQGDGIFMRSPCGTTYLIDGGSSDVSKVGEYRIQPFLKAKGIGFINYAIITHADSDHISGLKELIELEAIKIDNLVLPNTALKDEAYLELYQQAKNKKITIKFIEKGDEIKDRELTMTCLHPTNEYKTESRNAYSTVLSLKYKDLDLLLTGDVEEDGEKMIVDSKRLKDYDILKVAHHGSKYSTNIEFLDIAKPEMSIISCGKANRYGHPHEELLDRLKQIGSNIYITAELGAITVYSDGQKMEIRGFLE